MAIDKTKVFDAEILRINSDLNNISANDIKQIPEDVFVSGFLKMFTGEEVMSPDLPAVWSAIAGNPYMPVDVVDRDTGEILYRVPAIYERNAVDMKSDRSMPSILHVYISYRQIAGISPVQAAKYLEKELASRNQSSNFDTSENIRLWNIIFERYSKPTIGTDENGKPIMTSKVSIASGEDAEGPGLVYD